MSSVGEPGGVTCVERRISVKNTGTHGEVGSWGTGGKVKGSRVKDNRMNVVGGGKRMGGVSLSLWRSV